MLDLSLGDTSLILTECKKYGCTEEQAAYILATARWETAHTMKPVREAYWLSENWRKNNLRYYPWYGRGYVQLTWERNYEFAGEKIGVDLIGDPDRAMVPENAARILVQGSMEGWFTGLPLTKFVKDGLTDYEGARRVINGTDKAVAISGMASDYLADIHLTGSYNTVPNAGSVIRNIIEALVKLLKGFSK